MSTQNHPHRTVLDSTGVLTGKLSMEFRSALFWSPIKAIPKSFINISTGTYELTENNSIEDGTKIVIHLKDDCLTFSEEDVVKG